MNLPLARSYQQMAIVQRDCALAFESRARRAEFQTMRVLHTLRAQNCRVNMRLAALRMVDHLRPLEATRELRALGARQIARDIDSDSFKTNRPEQGAPRAASNGPSPYLRRLV